jgi:hypothetical protein
VRREFVEPIGFIEETKVFFLRGELRAKGLCRKVDPASFNMRCRGFDGRDNRLLCSCCAAGEGRE